MFWYWVTGSQDLTIQLLSCSYWTGLSTYLDLDLDFDFYLEWENCFSWESLLDLFGLLDFESIEGLQVINLLIFWFYWDKVSNGFILVSFSIETGTLYFYRLRVSWKSLSSITSWSKDLVSPNSKWDSINIFGFSFVYILLSSSMLASSFSSATSLKTTSFYIFSLYRSSNFLVFSRSFLSSFSIFSLSLEISLECSSLMFLISVAWFFKVAISYSLVFSYFSLK